MDAASAFAAAPAQSRVADLDPISAGVVLCLRLLARDTAQDRRGFEAAFGPCGGGVALAELDAICTICASFGAGPLRQFGLSTAELAADEARVARLVEAALRGGRDEAMFMACQIARADHAPHIVAHAQYAGVALARMAATPNSAQGCPFH